MVVVFVDSFDGDDDQRASVEPDQLGVGVCFARACAVGYNPVDFGGAKPAFPSCGQGGGSGQLYQRQTVYHRNTVPRLGRLRGARR